MAFEPTDVREKRWASSWAQKLHEAQKEITRLNTLQTELKAVVLAAHDFVARADREKLKIGIGNKYTTGTTEEGPLTKHLRFTLNEPHIQLFLKRYRP